MEEALTGFLSSYMIVCGLPILSLTLFFSLCRVCATQGLTVPTCGKAGKELVWSQLRRQQKL
jgi:hypothetical protein